MKRNTSSKTNEPAKVGTPAESGVADPVVARLDRIVELLGAIKVSVDTINAKVDTIDSKVQAPFDVSRLVKD